VLREAVRRGARERPAISFAITKRCEFGWPSYRSPLRDAGFRILDSLFVVVLRAFFCTPIMCYRKSRSIFSTVMRALVTGIHVFWHLQAWMAPSSCLPELGISKNRRKSGKPDVR
jgi:hypothetical protein